VKFLVDAQLPRRLALWLQQRGHDVIHTLDLAQQIKLTLLNPAAAAGVKTIARTLLAWLGLGAGGCTTQRDYPAL